MSAMSSECCSGSAGRNEWGGGGGWGGVGGGVVGGGGFFFNDTATTEIYTLSLHDALPIFWPLVVRKRRLPGVAVCGQGFGDDVLQLDFAECTACLFVGQDVLQRQHVA